MLFHGLLDLLAGLCMERRKGRRPEARTSKLQLGDRRRNDWAASQHGTVRGEWLMKADENADRRHEHMKRREYVSRAGPASNG